MCIRDSAYYVDVDGHKIGYTEGANGLNEPMLTLADGTGYGIVAVPNSGAPEDYEGLDVTGKIALVQRGTISFSDKCQNAADAGAVACLIYNNTSGTISMDLTGCTATIPCASLSMGDGAQIISALEENPALTVTFSDKEASVPSETASQINDFSSWGVAPDLSLEPEITAPGGNIYSTLNGGSYGLMSGTSMAAPNISGISALVMEYAKEHFGEDVDLRTMVNNLVMSTSAPLPYSDELFYSPRQQGSGMANAYNAVTTQAYLTVEGCDVPKAELRDDPEKTGRYDFTFQVNNFGGSSLYYDLDTTLQTEGVDDTYADYGVYFMSSTPVALSGATSERSSAMVLTHDVDDNAVTNSHDAYLIYQAAVAGHPVDENWTDVAFRYNLNGDEASDAADVQAYLDELVGFDVENVDLDATVLQVAAGESVDVSVSVALDTSAREYIETYYKNGIYVEGFTLLTAKNAGGVDLSLPYLAFYGDWTKADVIDSGFYWQPEEEQVYSQYLNCLFTQFDYYGYELNPELGINPYVEEDIDPSHISLSPNGDGCGDSVADIYVSLLRNAAELTVTYTDANTGEVYSEETVSHVSKSTYNNNYGQIIPYVYSWDKEPYDLTDEKGSPLPNNTKLVMTVSATIDYEGAEPDVWKIPITVDTEAPSLLEAKLWKDQSTGEQKLELTFRDNVSVAGVSLLNSAGTKIYGQYAVEDVEPGADGYQTYTATYDITGYTGKLMIILGDYAFNESSYAVNLGGSGASYGDLVGFQYDEFGVTNSWVSFSDGVDKDEVVLFQTDKEFVCAEYVNGFVFAETKDGKLYGFPYEDMLGDTVELDATYITTLENVYQDMAFNYKDGNLYGLYTSESDGYGTAEVYSINLKGEYYDEDNWMNYEPYQEDWVASRGNLYGLGLACDDEGAMYVLGTVTDEETGEESTAQLWKASWETEWGWTSLGAFTCIGDTGLNMNYLQSMTWDHNTERLYWAQFYPASMLNLESKLIEIDPETAGATEVGTLSSETAGLFAPLSSAAAASEAHQNVPEFDREIVGAPALGKTLLTLNVGGSEQLNCTFDPWYSSYTDVTWATSDETVATVSDDGTVTGVAAGSCTVTVTSVKDPTLSADCAVTVSALDLSIDGTTCVTGGGVGSVGNALLYHMSMTGGQSAMTLGNAINAPEDLNFGLKLACATLAKGSIWASEFGNTGMVYQIDPATGTVVDALQPIDGDMMYGLAYSENTGLFTGAANTDLYVDLPLTHDVEEEMLNSYDEERREFTWHRLDLGEYLAASDENFNTGESGFGSTVDVVISGITAIDRPYTYEDTYKDYLGDWSYNGSVNYTSDTTYVLLDNVGRLWYVDEICGLTQDEYGDYSNDSAYISSSRNGVLAQDNGDGTYNVFYLRTIEETPLLDMYRSGTMPRYTYHFSDLYYAGQAEDGGDMFFLSLYDYWNEGSSNQFYLYLSGTTSLDEETWEEVTTGRMLYDLGNAGAGNIVTTITSASVTGGLPVDGDDNTQEEVASNGLYVGFYKG